MTRCWPSFGSELVVSIEPEAREELRDAARWYEGARPGLGADFLLEVERSIARIAEGAPTFPIVGDTEGVRRVLLERFPYALVFVIAADRAVIISVAHGRRRPLYWAARTKRQ